MTAGEVARLTMLSGVITMQRVCAKHGEAALLEKVEKLKSFANRF
jgi:hypothetical protein